MFEKYLNFVNVENKRISLIYEGILGQALGSAVGIGIGAATGVDTKLAGAAGGAIGGGLSAKKGEGLKDAAIGGLGGAVAGWGSERLMGNDTPATNSTVQPPQSAPEGGSTIENAKPLEQQASTNIPQGADPKKPINTSNGAAAQNLGDDAAKQSTSQQTPSTNQASQTSSQTKTPPTDGNAQRAAISQQNRALAGKSNALPPSSPSARGELHSINQAPNATSAQSKPKFKSAFQLNSTPTISTTTSSAATPQSKTPSNTNIGTDADVEKWTLGTNRTTDVELSQTDLEYQQQMSRTSFEDTTGDYDVNDNDEYGRILPDGSFRKLEDFTPEDHEAIKAKRR